jgi:DNA-binding IclR family transcriptional regulator
MVPHEIDAMTREQGESSNFRQNGFDLKTALRYIEPHVRLSREDGPQLADGFMKINDMSRHTDAAASGEDMQSHASSLDSVDRNFVTALARGLDVLRCFSRNVAALGPTEVAQKSGLPKSTVTRLIHTLTKLDYLTYIQDSGKYRLGPAMLMLNTVPREQIDVREIARPLMQELASATGAQVALGVRDQLSILYLESFRGQSLVTLNLGIGSRIPLAITAGGRAYLAGLPSNERADLLERIRRLDEHAWLTIEPRIEAALKEYAETGCCSSIGDWVRQVNGIAAPLAPGLAAPPMVISIAGVADLYPAEKMYTEMRPKLLNLVRTIEARVGRHA